MVGEAGPLGKLAVVADLGAVRSPASRCDRLVRGVGMPLSFSLEGFIASKVSGLRLCPPRREARPEEGIARPWAELNEA